MKIIAKRRAAGITQAQLAELCDTTQQQIAKIETGVVDPRLSTLRKIAAALSCDLPELFYSRQEFLDEINGVVASLDLDLGKATVIDLNILCSKERGLPSFHPFWELVKIHKAKHKVIFKEDSK
jgi:transcriptional regulator with XRE-family HTH domain